MKVQVYLTKTQMVHVSAPNPGKAQQWSGANKLDCVVQQSSLPLSAMPTAARIADCRWLTGSVKKYSHKWEDKTPAPHATYVAPHPESLSGNMWKCQPEGTLDLLNKHVLIAVKENTKAYSRSNFDFYHLSPSDAASLAHYLH